MEFTIGEVAARTGVTERTLRYYEELGLLAPARDSGGRRRYDSATLDRLYRVRLLRALGTPVAEVDPDAADLPSLTRRHLRDLDARTAELARQRERVRAVEDRLLSGSPPGDEALLDLLATGGMCTAALAIHVRDVDAHFARAAAAGAEVTAEPVDQPYGYREYSAHDLEGHLWSFQTPLTDPDHQEASP